MEKKQKVWLITGATAGMGKALAEQVHQQGNLIAVSTRRNEGLQELEQLFPERSLPVVIDFNDPATIQAAVEKTMATFGRIDVLVNNAGYGIAGAVEEVNDAEAREQMETNFFGVLALTRAVLPGMRQRKAGHIIQISSSVAITAKPGLGLYSASKFALEGFTESLALEVEPLNIHVTMVQPGPVRTEFFGKSVKAAALQLPEYKEVTSFAREAGEQFHGRQDGDPAKIARAIIDLTAMEHPPLRLPLTPGTLEAMEKKIQWLQDDLQKWKAVAAATSFD